MEFELDFGTTVVGGATKADEGPLYASIDGLVAPLSNQECVFQEPDTGEVHVMTLDVLTAMDASRQFLPLAQHTRLIEEKLPALRGKSHAIEKVLNFLIQRNLMVSADQMAAQLRADSGVEAEAPAALVVRTCNRPAELKRLADSLQRYEDRYGRGLRTVVLDDSRQPDVVRANADSLAALQGNCHHLDRAWRSRLADRLVKGIGDAGGAGPVQRILGLDDPDQVTCGAPWNAALLLTAGHRLLMLDDDYQLDARQRPESQKTLGLSEPEFVPMTFEPEIDRLGEQLQAVDRDPLELHIASCGRAAGVLFDPSLGLSADAATLRGYDYRKIRSLLGGNAIKTTAGGAWGDWRMDTTLWFYLMPQEYTRSIYSEPKRYLSLMHRPVLAHGYDQAQLTRLSNFTPVGIDNSELLPCTVPTGRGEDFTFAAWLRFLYPQSICVNWPVMLRHERPETGSESPYAHAYLPWMSRFAGEYALSRLDRFEAEEASERIQALAFLFRDLAGASPQRRLSVLREFLAFMRSHIVQQAQTRLTSLKDVPQQWADDATAWITENGKALTSPGAPRLRDWPADTDDLACAELLASSLTAYAEDLELWPRLWSQCQGQTEELLRL
ncbi:MAG: hypothetical protein QNJ40_14140 [Xanthomonadales bacterium]|nr:hypothetical protein [Xanthomonadales bacterium]